jgi:hypothetical protein
VSATSANTLSVPLPERDHQPVPTPAEHDATPPIPLHRHPPPLRSPHATTCYPSPSEHRRANPWSPLPLAPTHMPLPSPQGCRHPSIPTCRHPSPLVVRAPPCQCLSPLTLAPAHVPLPSPQGRRHLSPHAATPPHTLYLTVWAPHHLSLSRTAPPSPSPHRAEACHAASIESGLSLPEHRVPITVPTPRQGLPCRRLGVTGTSLSWALLLIDQ